MDTFLLNYPLRVIGCLSLLLMGLLTCRPPVDELPKGASLQIVMAQNRPLKPVYFWEDSLQRQVSFELYYFDQNLRFTSLPETPLFLVNGQPMAGSTFTFSGPGQYVFSARITNQTSDNQLVLTVSRAKDYLKAVIIKAPVLWLNADSLSQLPLTYELITRQGQSLNTTDYPSPQLWADDQLQSQGAFFSTPKADIHRLEARFLGIPSNVLSVTARPVIHYPLIRLPVVFHVPKELATAVNPAKLLAAVNQFFRQQRAGADPNRLDAAIEFYPAPTNPQGQPMAIAGLHPLSNTDSVSVREAQGVVATLLHTWCPRQYINVLIGMNWIDSYAPSTNYAFMPVLPPAGMLPPTCADLAAANWSSAELPAIHLAPGAWLGDNGTFAHELGHFLGLPHSFRPNCEGSSVFKDVPNYLASSPDGSGCKYSCQGAAFVADNLMDYNSNWRSFTQDQVNYMRLVLDRGRYIPSPSRGDSPGYERNPLQGLNQGSILP